MHNRAHQLGTFVAKCLRKMLVEIQRPDIPEKNYLQIIHRDHI